MNISWTSTAWDDYLYWNKTDKKKFKRINELIKQCMRTPFEGIGNPEPLKHDLQGYWSRRIDSQHRLVYSCTEKELEIIACRYHY
ncbi:MAG: Txe/YoeB family addiction module toxin [Bacteroidetes bacterium]|nr:MAG: Txe/YoeB family addiction module toxin [Bacteroidota bacterium]